MTVYLSQNSAVTAAGGKDTLLGIEKVEGGAGVDSLTGDAADNTLTGLAGDDVLRGGAGNDSLYGNEDSDLLIGGAGDDYMNGGSGGRTGSSDTVSYAGVTSALEVDIFYGRAVSDETGQDRLEGIESVISGNGRDKITGNDNDNILKGGGGGDVIDGKSGNDLLYGEAGNDVIYGDFGNDRFFGGAGNDTFKFYHYDGFSEGDVIEDFINGDHIVLFPNTLREKDYSLFP